MDYVDKDFGKILKNNAQTLRHELLPLGTDCFRVYDRNLSRYPVTVDLYGKYAKVTDYGDQPLSDEERASCIDICSRMLYLEAGNVIYAYRNKRPDRAQHEKNSEEAIRTTVHENGLSFAVDLTTYVDTGLFLDHAVTRRMIMERSEKADVLNLFSYTGSFSVYAAAGGAESVTSVDMSATYTRWAEENLAENGYLGSSFSCVCMDADKFIDQAMSEGRKYDIIIFDPPSFSNSRKMGHDFDVARDWSLWVKRLFGILKKTGFILFSTNLGTFQMDRRRLRGLSVREITGSVWAPGFVKGRPGTVRSWIMAFDDDSLTLDWSEPEKKSEKGSDTERRDSHRREDGERRRERRPSFGKPAYGKSPYGSRERSERPRPERSGYERRERRFPDDERRERFSREDRPYGERRPRPERSDRYSDRYEREDRPYRSDRYERTERPERSDRFERRERPERPRYEREERRSFDRKPYERRDSDRFERRPRYDEDRPERRERRERPSYDRPYDQERSFDRERPVRPVREKREFHRSEDSFERRPSDGRRDLKKTKKPFGYDSFKPARSRDDNPDFFWNAEDLDPKKEK